MDNLEEADKILEKIQQKNIKKPIILLHQAELQIHKNEFHLAVALLKKAQKLMSLNEIVSYSPNNQDFRELNFKNLKPEEIIRKKELRRNIIEKRKRLQKNTERQLCANIFALLGKIF